MVSKEVADAVIAIISCESETLSVLAEKFKKCCSKVDQMSILTSLAALIMDDILDPPQQIITVWLLYSSFSHIPIKQNPFYEVLQFIVQSGASASNTYSQKLCDIIGCFLSSLDLDEIKDRSVHEILDDKFSVDSSGSSEMMGLGFPPAPRISPVIVSKSDTSETQVTQHQLLRELLIDPSLWTDFDVPFSRLAPDVCAPGNEELQFMHVSSFDAPPFIFDEMNSLNMEEAAKLFIMQAPERPLKSWETECVVSELKNNPGACKEVNLKKPQIDKLLEINPQVGAIFVREYIRENKNAYQAFTKGDITVANIEVVRDLMTNLDPPPSDLLKGYVANALNVLHGIKDRQQLETKAKMFCNMIASLHKHKVVFGTDVLLDLGSIEMELARKGIPEASLLSDLNSS